MVKSFKEKPQTDKGRINGGFFVFNKKFFEFIDNNENVVLEAEPLEKVTNIGELMAFKHDGFWQCMDTPRDKDLLENFVWNRTNILGYNDKTIKIKNW